MKRFCLVLFSLFLLISFVNTTSAEEVVNVDNYAYKSIVKIKTFSLNEDYFLKKTAEGSGIIISKDGMILTNYHVVIENEELNNSIKESAYQICLVDNSDEKPDCSYVAKLIAHNKDLDVALLKIQNIPELNNLQTFPFLNLNRIDNTKTGDQITAFGFPGIGGDTITITSGSVSGKVDRNNIRWIKTDAVISFGNSGGAAIDKNGDVVGITTEVASDFLGSLGYIISASSLVDWIDLNSNKSEVNNNLSDKIINFTKKDITLGKSDKFENKDPLFSITKPADWVFDYNGESDLFIEKSGDDEGGLVSIHISKVPYQARIIDIDGFFRRSVHEQMLSGLTSIDKSEVVNIAGHPAKKISYFFMSTNLKTYLVPVGNYLFDITLDYGYDNKDKDIVDNIISSLVINETARANEAKEYSHNNPKFFITSNDNWVFSEKNDITSPLFLVSKVDSGVFADIGIKKNSAETKEMSNKEYIENWSRKNEVIRQSLKFVNLQIELLESSDNFNLSDELKNIVMLEYLMKSDNDSKIISYNREYHIKTGDNIIIISFNYYGDDKVFYEKTIADFNHMLSSFSLLAKKTEPVVLTPVPITTPAPTTEKDINKSEELSQSKTQNKPSTLNSRLKGKIVIKVEDAGKAYYINPVNNTINYLGRPDDAFAVMRNQGVGITSLNLDKIPLGLSNLSGLDSDGDKLPDAFEDAIGTDKNKKDSDGDGYDDYEELLNGYNPLSLESVKIKHDLNFAKTHAGKIFLDVERNGEAWYINPDDGKRYFLGRPADAFSVMRILGLGISNSNFDDL